MQKKVKRGFTLIELLVVIAIIAILAAILFPVFARARENARRASCQSNLKQIALGVFMYNQDYDEKLPTITVNAAANTTASNPYGWADALQPYLKSTQIFQCPSETNGPGVVGTSSGLTPGPEMGGYTDYYMNSAGSGVADATFNAPAQTILLGDGGNGDSRYAYDGCIYTDLTAGSSSGTACAAYTTIAASAITNMAGAGRHLDGGNYAFADGHVKWLKGSIMSGTTINGSSSIGNKNLTTTNATTGIATFSPS
jgi:prepilin-type N-terminal cleavage/methylation domain-containing protein/prepilin-type processing-associated H-X9-DG protein